MTKKAIPVMGAALAVIFSINNAAANIPTEDQTYITENRSRIKTLIPPPNICKQLDTRGSQILENISENFFKFIKQSEEEARKNQKSITFTALSTSFNQQQILSDSFADKLRNAFVAYPKSINSIEQYKRYYIQEITTKNLHAVCTTPKIDNHLKTTGQKISLTVNSYFALKKALEAQNKSTKLTSTDIGKNLKPSELEPTAQ